MAFGSAPRLPFREGTIPATTRSFALTELYRERLQVIRIRAERLASQQWERVDLADLEPTYTDWLGSTASAVARAQQEAVRLSGAYLTAFLSTELGHRVRNVDVDPTLYAGKSRDGRPLADAYDSPRIGVLVALKDGADNAKALGVGLLRATRAVELDTLHAARTATLDRIESDDRFDGWQRAVRGTCGACAGAAKGTESGLRFQVHPGCQCVSEPVVKGARDRFPRPTGPAIFAAKSSEEQDEMLGPEAAEKVRSGEVELADLVATSPLEEAEDFITQKPIAAL